MIYLVVLSALYALHLLLKLHWITTVVIGGFLLLRISGHRKWYKKKIVYERKFEEVSEYLDMLLYAFVKEEKVEKEAPVALSGGEGTGQCRCGDGGWSDARSSPKSH